MPPTPALRAHAPRCPTRPRRVVPRGIQVPCARFLETGRRRNLLGCRGLTNPGAPAGPASPNRLSLSPHPRPPVPLGPQALISLPKGPRSDLTLSGVELNFPRSGDEERELVQQPRQPLGHPHVSTGGIPTREAKPSQPASPELRCLSSLSPAALRAGRRGVSAASRAAAPAPSRPVSPHHQPPLPEPLLHRTAALQPRSPPARSPQPRSASCASTALRSTPLRSCSARGNHSTQQERCQYSHPRPGQRGEEPAPRGRARPISGRCSLGSPSRAQPAGPPAPSRTRSAVPVDYRCGRATWWVARGPAGHHPGTCKTQD